jgi:L-cysteine desulfidase
MGDSVYNKLVAVTASACDVRMAGAMVPVMSNSGSGNQGITATLPVVVFAEEMNKSKDKLIRALALSHLMVIYIKRGLGRFTIKYLIYNPIKSPTILCPAHSGGEIASPVTGSRL